MLVLDAIMGAGKTTYVINKIKKEPEKLHLFITPFISECERVSEATGIATPSYDVEGSKLEQACELLKNNKSLVITHSLFLLIPKVLIKKLSKYDIVIDEALSTCEHIPIASGEIESMLHDKVVVVAEEFPKYKRLETNSPDHLKNTALLAFHHSRLLGNSDIILSDNKLLMMTLPPELFHNHERMTLLTYNFENSDFDCYLELRNIRPDLKSITNGELVDYVKTDGSSFRHLVKVVDHPKLNEQVSNKNQRYTKKFYYNAKRETLGKIKKDVFNFFNNITNSPSSRNLWTVFETSDLVEYFTDQQGALWFTGKSDSKNVRDVIIGRPYRQVGKQKFEYDMSHVDVSKGMCYKKERKRQCWIPLNCKGTNDYADRDCLAYLVNLNMSPALINFFNCVIDRKPCNDTFALNMMVQWVFRSAIRNGEPITVYIPSKRMRHLFLTWLGYTDEELF